MLLRISRSCGREGFCGGRFEAFGESCGESCGESACGARRSRRSLRPLDHDAVDAVLGGGLARGAVHEILAEEGRRLRRCAWVSHWRWPCGSIAAGRCSGSRRSGARAEDGAPYPQGIAMMAGENYGGKRRGEGASIPPASSCCAHRDARSTLWAMEQGFALSGTRYGSGRSDRARREPAISTASRRLVLGGARGGATGLLVQAGSGARDLKIASAARTRWLIGAHQSRRGLAGEPGPGGLGACIWPAIAAGARDDWLREWDHEHGRFQRNRGKEKGQPQHDQAHHKRYLAIFLPFLVSERIRREGGLRERVAAAR